jgi:hypothetical protein
MEWQQRLWNSLNIKYFRELSKQPFDKNEMCDKKKASGCDMQPYSQTNLCLYNTSRPVWLF